jgi:hypothetical protein
MYMACVFFLLIIFNSFQIFANEFDLELADTLKIEANHNVLRLRSFDEELAFNKIFDQERENGLSEYLEEQERWDLIRERGLREFRAQKRQVTPQEGSFEHNQYLEELESQIARYEKSRKAHIATKNKFVYPSLKNELSRLELEELGINSKRPRFDVKLRSQNKWVNVGKSSGFSSGGSSSGFQPTAPPPIDYSPAPEFPPAPAPYEGGEDLVPIPPPIYDSNGGEITDFGGSSSELMIPPPPPPPPDFDF